MSDLVFMVTATALTCVVVGVAGRLALRAVCHRSVTFSVVVCALAPVVAVIAAVQVNVQAMFLSEHDAEVIAIVLTTAAVLAIALAVVLGRRLAAGSRLIGDRLGRLTGAYADHGAADRPPSAELAALTAQLDDVHRTLEESRARERALEGGRRELVAALSHDLRTPLAGIRALAEGLEDGVVDDVPAALAQIRANTERLARMTDHLFELSRLQALPRNRRDTLVSVRELIEDVVAEARPGAAGVDVELQADVRGRLPVRGDGGELTRAFANLMANAVRHTPAGGTVTIAAEAEAGQVRLTVADRCGGIHEPVLSRVFEPGWRGEPERGGLERAGQSDGSGSGLGLAIVREVIAGHDGTVTVANIEGGCQFEITLPGSIPA